MTAEHNHPPRCCCHLELDQGRCLACPWHGDLAQGVECPQCHQAAGRPHTDYCPLQLADDPWHAPLTGIEVRNPENREYPGQPGARADRPEYPMVCRRCCGYGLVDGKPCPTCAVPPR